MAEIGSWEELAPETRAAIKDIMALLMRVIGPAADHWGWPLVLSALTTIQTPLLATCYGEAVTQEIYRRMAAETPRIAESWVEYFAQKRAAEFAVMPVEGHG